MLQRRGGTLPKVEQQHYSADRLSFQYIFYGLLFYTRKCKHNNFLEHKYWYKFSKFSFMLTVDRDVIQYYLRVQRKG